jgi:hypothetical protein
VTQAMSRSPEADFSAWLDEHHIHCLSPAGEAQAVAVNRLRSVYLETNDTGPWGADVWFVLDDGVAQCVFPLGATGEALVLDRLRQLPGFLMKGMGSTSTARFLCWSADNQESGA